MKKLFITLPMVAWAMCVNGQQYWSKTYQLYPQEYDEGTQLIFENERILVAGEIGDSLSTVQLATVRELNSEGTVLQTHSYQIPYAPTFNNAGLPNSFIQHQDSGYVWFVYPGWWDTWVRYDDNLDTLYTLPIDNPIDQGEFFNIHQIIPDNLSENYYAIATTDWAISGGVMLMKLGSGGEVLEYYPDIIDDHYIEAAWSTQQTNDGNILLGGYVADYDEDFYPPYEYDACVGKFTTEGVNIWQHTFGHPDYNDDHAVAIELADESVAMYYVRTDSIQSDAAPWSTYGTIERVNINQFGQVIDTSGYYEGLRGARFYDIQMNDDKIYALGQQWGGYSFFNSCFLLVTDLQGNELNYTELYHLECTYCENYLYDLDIAPNGDVAMVGYVELDTLGYGNTHKTWVVKTDCMGRFQPPPLSFSADIVQNGDTVYCTSTGEGVFDFSWNFGSGEEEGDTLQHIFTQAGEYTITATGSYCTVDLDTTFTIQILDCMGNLGTPPLSVNASAAEISDGTFLFSSNSENLENIFWIIEGEEFLGEEVQYTFADTGSFVVEACGWYCDSLVCETVEISVVAGMQQVNRKPQQHIQVWPNPADDILNVGCDEIIEHISITDISGKLLYNRRVNSRQTLVLTNEIGSFGFYLLEVTTDSGFVERHQIVLK